HPRPVESGRARAEARHADAIDPRFLRELGHGLQRLRERGRFRLLGWFRLQGEAVDHFALFGPLEDVTRAEAAVLAARTIFLEHAQPFFLERDPDAGVHVPGAVAPVSV